MAVTRRLLLIDDDRQLAELIVQGLRANGFQVFWAANGRDGLNMAFRLEPDLIVLDVMMPGMDGWTVCERLRKLSNVPIVMLTALNKEDFVIRGLQIGVDDYIAKPFSFKELVLRINAILNRALSRQDQTCLFDDGVLCIDLEHRCVSRQGQSIHLTPTEFRVLDCLVRQMGYWVSAQQLSQEIWGGHTTNTSGVSLYIGCLRKKLEADPQNPQYIHTGWGIGYCFNPAHLKNP